ncbi:MAG: hypothetical protein QF921_02670 [Pseudomonadales bacterium]|jgi:ABC-2 type transport system permease protein|nr:hypothetical protein [Pseudomonadales bacterium]MDP6472497.1 hypothetical protein [Pseudomonadales bacterium]MDP6828692.1 hypothetical protein [Pseudomonadales bacterium]MDP6970412.1 hypothetical protein [Pseudomonadales bacterium]|tara:strand:- start:530 stop:1462 length:933 start_codon:yes stop_codon:yes gene_type:complete
MNVWKGLLTREWLEHKGALGWGPVITFGVIVVFVMISLAIAGTVEINLDLDDEGHRGSITALIDESLSEEIPTEAALANRLDKIRHGVAEIFLFVFFIIAFFTLLGMLFDDRKDRSVLFWKSVPASDAETVLSKYVTIAWIGPVATIAMIMATYVFLFVVMTFLVPGRGALTVGNLWSNSGLVVGLVELIAGFAVHGLWALPIYAWLLLVSSAVTRAPFAWAVFMPIVIGMLERITFGTGVLFKGIGNHLSLKAIPTAIQVSVDEAPSGRATGLGDTFALFATSDMWIGIVIGAAFLYGAIYLRTRNNEI